MRYGSGRIKLIIIASIVTGPCAAASAAPEASREITPPKEVRAQLPSSVIAIRPGASSETLKKLTVKREIGLQSVRSNSLVKLRSTNVDFKPMLDNPLALFNVAQKLREKPQLATVQADETRIFEVGQGLIVRSLLSYQIKLGVCNDASKRKQLAASGIQCAKRVDSKARAAAFANPDDPHYIASVADRAKAIASAEAHAAEVSASIDSDIANLRARFADPAQKAELVAQIGAAEVARLQGLNDDALKTEMVNSGEVTIEEVMFVPAADRLDNARNRSGSKAKLPVITSTKKDLQTAIFLTGFTLGRNYEWRQRVEKSIKWCVLGCKKTYYAEVYAGFDYGFGLRFPIKLDGTYQHRDDAGTKSATVRVDYAPFNGSTQDYAAAGLPADKLFDGKEIVAQFGAYAGFGYKIPFYGSLNLKAEVGEDFTKGFDAPFTGGQFTPPLPGAPAMPPLVKTFTDVDLIAGRANFGVVGAKVFPAVKAELLSDSLTFTLRDNVLGKDITIASSGQVVNLGIEANDQTSSFTIGDPVYDLSFLVTPGLLGRIFIDISVWSHSWDWPVWFPQLAVKLPPDGVKFQCHEDTVCSRNYLYSPTGAIETAGAKAGENTPFHAELAQWSKAFDEKWLPQCLDKKCKTGIKLVRVNAELEAKQKYDAAPKATTSASIKPVLDKAETSAATLIQESKDRKANKEATKKAGTGWVLIYKAVWLPKCADQLCRTNVTALIDQMPAAAEEKQKQYPDEDSLHVQAMVGKDFAPKLQKEVDDSKARMQSQRVPDDPNGMTRPPPDPPSRKP
jgi:hypothetical protein